MTEKKTYNMPKYFRHSLVHIQDVLEAVSLRMRDREQSKTKAIFNGVATNAKSLRLQTFAKYGTKCVCCGLEASYFALERNYVGEVGNTSYHLNLWGIADGGRDVLFTHDHILARSLGGKDNLSNTQTMCSECNWEKGEEEQLQVAARKKINK